MHFLSSKVCLWYLNIDLKVTGNGDFAKFCRNYCDNIPSLLIPPSSFTQERTSVSQSSVVGLGETTSPLELFDYFS